MDENIYSVSKLSSDIKLFVEANFENIRVKGEVQGLKLHQSGHVYFSLKDDSGLIDAICWKWSYMKQSLKLEDGMEIICSCDVTTYPMRSKYQIIVKSFQIAGEGALLKMLEERKKKLLAEGYFAKKRPLPYIPTKIGVITSETGAVFHDIMNRLRDRFPIHVVLWPVIVQGDGAVNDIKAAIRGFNAMDAGARPDVLIIARGGGSVEDLMVFNDEEIVKAVFHSEIPTISAIGHETDTTLIDYAADRRAATPTAAAELVVPVKSELLQNLREVEERLSNLAKNIYHKNELKLHQFKLSYNSLVGLLQIKMQRLDYAVEKITNLVATVVERKAQRFQLCHKMLESYSYQNTLKRGFAIVYSKDGKVIRDATDTAANDEISIKLVTSTILAKIIKN